MARKQAEDLALNMTPMIDVVFQLIIFFIITLKITEQKNEDIILEDSRYGPTVKEEQTVMVVEVDRRGTISVHGVPISRQQLYGVMKQTYDRYGRVLIQIRGDYRAPHQYVRKVMDTCAEAGLYQISIQGVKEHHATPSRSTR